MPNKEKRKKQDEAQKQPHADKNAVGGQLDLPKKKLIFLKMEKRTALRS